MADEIRASEQKSVFLDIKEWLTKIIPADVNVSISNIGVENELTIAPEKGVRRNKKYACGGYEVYLPFMLYFRAVADDDNSVSGILQLLDDIGYKLENNGTEGIPELKLSGNREIIAAYQELTSSKCRQAGKISDFIASYVIIYSNED